ncbi:MAG: septation protein A [Rickettsiales bacterium]
MLKLLLESGPLFIFLLTYKNSDLLLATKIMIISTILFLIISYLVDRKISVPLLVSGIILVIMGGITVLTGDTTYFKMKPTIAYIIFAVALFVGLLFNQLFVKHLFNAVFELEDQHWAVVTKRFIGLFIFLAIINEVVWRNFSENFWVNFKVFGVLPLCGIFFAMQIPFIKAHNKKNFDL